ncbi:MAG: hypothetical protein ACTHZ9_08520 [Leucobacter sp.]
METDATDQGDHEASSDATDHDSGSERDASNPTATAPDAASVSTDAAAKSAGKDGPDAADSPTAKGKREADHDTPKEIGEDLEPDEAADVLETRRESREIREEREASSTDEDQITLDTPD